MGDTALVLVATSSLSVAALLFVSFRLWPCSRLDLFRQELFALRDELFDYAADGHINFDHPAYSLLRKLMNGFIRYAHNLTFFRISVLLAYRGLNGMSLEPTWSKSWNEALDNVPDEIVKAKLRDFHNRVASMIASRIVLGSPVLLSIAGMMYVQKQLQTMKQVYVKLTDTAIDYRILEEEAVKPS